MERTRQLLCEVLAERPVTGLTAQEVRLEAFKRWPPPSSCAKFVMSVAAMFGVTKWYERQIHTFRAAGIYATLRNLVDEGVVEYIKGYDSKFRYKLKKPPRVEANPRRSPALAPSSSQPLPS